MRQLFIVGFLATHVASVEIARAQQDTVARLDTVVVTVTRGPGRTVLGSPFALTVVRPDSSRPGQRHTAVDESLALIPGLSATNRNNPSQDPRLSIRGFGARSAFGVRGVRVLRDGIPLTLPDGQTPLDYLSLESVGSIEVLRGSASALYGNASGGVIDIRSIDPREELTGVDARQWIGSNAFYRSVLAASGSSPSLGWVADVANTRTDGSRDHSRQRTTVGFARTTFTTRSLRFGGSVMALDNPLSQNPGALTIEEMQRDAGAADPGSVRRNARKVARQVQVGGGVDTDVGGGEFSFSAYGGARALDNPLSFAVIDIGRRTWGASAAFRKDLYAGKMRNRFISGLDFQSQNDKRRNFIACADTVANRIATTTCPDVMSDRGSLTLDQREIVSSIGGYVSNDIQLSPRLVATVGVRADNVAFRVDDHFIAAGNPNDSGKRNLNAVSPMVGVVARVTPLISLYSNIASAFETPTATELGNQPDGTAGINNDLDPQRSITIEAGSKGYAGAGLTYDVAIYNTRVADELVPFEIPGSNGRRYFRNAGQTSRRGVEAGGTLQRAFISMMASYAYSRFRFEDFAVGDNDFAGNTIPGIPRHRGQFAVAVKSQAWFGLVEAEIAGSSFADDANSRTAPGYSVFHSRGGVAPFRANRRISLTVGIQNLLDKTYASSLAVNAARERYFEPATKRSLSLGLSLGTSRTDRAMPR